MTDIREYLKNEILLFDGAMGTLLSRAAGKDGVPELFNLTDGERVSEIHRAYISAGARAVKTNTFGASRMSMSEGECVSVIRRGFEIANEFSDKAYVFADIGPVSVTDAENLSDEYIFIANAFIECGAKYFLFETNSTLDGLIEVSRHIKERVPDAYVIVSFASLPDGFTRTGRAAASLIVAAANEAAIDAVGLNCASGAGHMGKLISGIGSVEKALSAMPNAGYPTVLGNRTFYGGAPDYFARELLLMAEGGVRIIGGCCGTTPEHIRKASELIKTETMSGIKETGFRKTVNAEKKVACDRALKRSRFTEELEDPRMLPFAVELDPPEGADIEKFMKGASELVMGGASAITIADCPIARARMDSSILACKVKRELGIDALPHMTCRDRNLNAIKALLLGLHAEGVHNVLTVTGDPIPSAERSEVKSVYNFNSRMLAEYISALGKGTLAVPFNIFGALNVNARNFDMQLKIAEEKERAGVTAFLTQPILTERAIENLKRAREVLNGKILGGIFPLVSYKNACYMSSEVAGVKIDERVIALYDGKSREECEELAIMISYEVAKAIGPYIDGYYIMTPFSRTALVCKIMAKIREQ